MAAKPAFKKSNKSNTPKVAPKAGKSFVFEATLEKETPGALKFAEVDSNGVQVDDIAKAVCGTIYLRKSAVGNKVQNIRVTVEVI